MPYKDKEKEREHRHEYRLMHKEQERKRHKRFLQRHPGYFKTFKAYHKWYRQTHKKQERKRVRAWKLQHKARSAEHSKKYRRLHKKLCNEYNKRWRRQHLELVAGERARHYDKGFIKIADNPFPGNITVDWHHIAPNKPYVVPVPREIHRSVMGRHHYVYLAGMVAYLYDLNLNQ